MTKENPMMDGVECGGSKAVGAHAVVRYVAGDGCPLCAALWDRDAARAEAEAERAGNGVLRQKYGARDNETMEEFIERLHQEAGLAADLGCAAQKLIGGDGLPEVLANLTQEDVAQGMRDAIATALGEVELALAGGRNPEWGPLAQIVVELRGYIADVVAWHSETMEADDRRARELLARCDAYAKTKNLKGPTP